MKLCLHLSFFHCDRKCLPSKIPNFNFQTIGPKVEIFYSDPQVNYNIEKITQMTSAASAKIELGNDLDIQADEPDKVLTKDSINCLY